MAFGYSKYPGVRRKVYKSVRILLAQKGYTSAMKVWIEMHNGAERTYEEVTRVDDTDRYKVKIYGAKGLLARVDKGDLKNLLTDETET